MKKSLFLLLLLLIFLSSCGISKKKDSKEIDSLVINNNKLELQVKKLAKVIDTTIVLEDNIINHNISTSIDSNSILVLEDQSFDLDNKISKILLDKNIAFNNKDSLTDLGWIFQEHFPFFYKKARTGRAPKSCSFSPDGLSVAVTLLNQEKTAVQFFNTDSFIKTKTLYPYCNIQEKNNGYAEGLWKNNNEFWFTRMTTGDFFIWNKNKDSLEYFDSNGTWTKVIKFNPKQN